MTLLKIVLPILFAAVGAFSQTKESFNQEGTKAGLLDPSRLSIQHNLSFGLGGSSAMNMQSQGLYSTLLTYKFSQPVTLHLNFGFPLYSTFSPYGNLNQQNVTSLAYFKNMPIDATISWQPTNNVSLHLNVVRNPQYDYFPGMAYPVYSSRRHLFQSW
jgi:hypothetical protein